ncbi:MAG: peptidoglycan DD-metalloendopeptidase family protein [Hyphomicrobiaceae bacterium]|nr:peptidoglycan DD-metalloendopeptidase family protein [Hyphomicrobiaceae bacterium]
MAFAVAVHPGFGQAQAPDDARRKLDTSKKALDDTQRRKQELQADIKSIADEYDRLRQKSVEQAKAVRGSEEKLSGLEARLTELREQELLVRGSLTRSHGSISTLLAALQRMGRNPPPVMITQREDALSMVRSAMLLASAFPEMRTQALALSEKLGELVRVMDQTRVESEQYKAEVARYRDEQLQLANNLEQRKKVLTERHKELTLIGKLVSEKSKDVADVSDLISKIDTTIAEQTQLGAYERQLQKERDVAHPDPPPSNIQPSAAPIATADVRAKPVVTSDIPGVASKPEAVGTVVAMAVPPIAKAPVAKAAPELKPSITLQPGERIAMMSPGRIQPAIPFHLAKARLPLPVQGKIILNYGDRTQSGQSQGIVLETRTGGQVTSPSDGWVMYAGEFRSYGKILIINCGGGYHILLAGLSLIDVQIGQFVLAGEPVGTMAGASKTPKTGRDTGREDNAPVLYVEFRKDQRPVDPRPWWVENGRKVQG